MGEVVIKIAKWALTLAFIITISVAVLALMAIIASYMIIGFNMNVLTDIMSLIQMWLPFNLNVIMAWIAIAGTAYLAYLLSLKAFLLINAYLN